MLSQNLEATMQKSIDLAKKFKHSQATIDHLLLALTEDEDAQQALMACSVDVDKVAMQLTQYLSAIDTIKSQTDNSAPNVTFQKIIHRAVIQANLSGISKEISGVNALAEILLETDSFAAKLLHEHNITRLDIINYLIHGEDYHSFILSQQNHDNNNILISRSFESDFAVSPNENTERYDEPEALKNYCINLNRIALEGKIDILIGREDEIERLTQTLCRRNKNNPLLVGEPGVGKTAIVEGLAHKIALGKVPKMLKNAVIFALDLGSLLAGTRYRGDFEERIKLVIKELAELPYAILFIDEIHSIIGAGSTNGNALDASNLLKPALARGQIKCIGSTTHDEYYKHFAKDKSLVRRFQQINVEEPSVAASIAILNGLRSYYEKYHNVRYSPEAIEASVTLSKRYLPQKQLPDKAIDVIDETGAHLSLHNEANKNLMVEIKDIEFTVAKMAKLPAISVTCNEAAHLQHIEEELTSLIFGQNDAIKELCSSIKLSRAGLREEKKPIGCYMFAGPTGVGKTELALQFSKLLNMNMIRFDMSEYLEQHSISKLVGSPPGYVGYDTGGLLTEEISKHPYSVLLLDEIEKAHKDIYNILLQIMDYGTLTDHQGKKVSFHNTIIIMTTNAGASTLYKNNIGFDNQNSKEIDNREEIEKLFSPEFRNRLDSIIQFKPLCKSILMNIAQKFVNNLQEQLKSKDTEILLSTKVYDYICKNGFSDVNGARVMERLINEKIKKIIANEILFGKLIDGGKVKIDYAKDDLKFEITSYPKSRKDDSKTSETATIAD